MTHWENLLDRAVAAMVSALEVYNKPSFTYRAESFMILAINAWELLAKAKWLQDNNDNMKILYVYQQQQGQKHIKQTRSGNPMTQGLLYLGRKLVEKKELDQVAYKNLEILSESRDSAVHFYYTSPTLAQSLQAIGAACIRNFVTAAEDWFGFDFSEYNTFPMPLAFLSPSSVIEGVGLNRAENNFLLYLRDSAGSQEQSTSPYAILLNFDIRFTKSKSKDVPAVRITTDPEAPKVQLTEEQVLEQYPWTYRKLVSKCRERYSDFKEDRDFHAAKRELEIGERYVYARKYNPLDPNSSTRKFYNPNILREFDKIYTRKSEESKNNLESA